MAHAARRSTGRCSPAPRRYTRAGGRGSGPASTRDVSPRLWRALGFPDVPDDVPVFTDVRRRGAAAARRALRFIASRRSTDDPIDGARRSRSARSAAASRGSPRRSATDRRLGRSAPRATPGSTDEDDRRAAYTESLDWDALVAALRLRAAAAGARRGAGASSPSTTPSTRTRCRRSRSGFVDLVGYTALSQELEDDELGALVAPVRGADPRHDRGSSAVGS